MFNYAFNTTSTAYPGTRVLTPNEVFQYGSFIRTTFPQHKTEPMIGFKIQMKDTRPGANPAEKVNMLDQYSQQLFVGKYCMMREGIITDINSYYLISLPVPRSMLSQQLQNISYVLQALGQNFGICRQALTEISVSGKANMYETDKIMSSIIIPPQYMQKIVPFSGLSIGQMVWISREFACLRTKWNIPEASVLDDMGLIAQLISSVFH